MTEPDNSVRGDGGISEPESAVLGGGGITEPDSAVLGGGQTGVAVTSSSQGSTALPPNSI
jgi:hypothetical protein